MACYDEISVLLSHFICRFESDKYKEALITRAMRTQIYLTRQDPRFTLCKEAPEKIQHITVGYRKAYVENQNQLAGITGTCVQNMD